MSQRGLLVVGDTNLQASSDPARALAEVAPLLRAASAVIGQHEGLYTDTPDAAEIAHKPLWRHAPPAVAGALAAAGFRAVGLASNVAYPASRIAGTVAALGQAGIAHAGIGANRAAARLPAIIQAGGLRVGLLSYTSVFWPVGHAAGEASPGAATIRAHTAYQPGRRALEMPGDPPIVATWPDAAELAAMQHDIAALRPRVDLLLLSCHWGVSSSAVTLDYQRAIARAAVQAGADMVFGHHPHVIQGAELIDGRPVFYSLGNFVFDWHVMRGRHLDGLALSVLPRAGGPPQVAVLPVRRGADDNLLRPHDRDDSEGARILDDFAALCRPFGTALAPCGEALLLAT